MHTSLISLYSMNISTCRSCHEQRGNMYGPHYFKNQEPTSCVQLMGLSHAQSEGGKAPCTTPTWLIVIAHGETRTSFSSSPLSLVLIPISRFGVEQLALGCVVQTARGNFTFLALLGVISTAILTPSPSSCLAITTVLPSSCPGGMTTTGIQQLQTKQHSCLAYYNPLHIYYCVCEGGI